MMRQWLPIGLVLVGQVFAYEPSGPEPTVPAEYRALGAYAALGQALHTHAGRAPGGALEGDPERGPERGRDGRREAEAGGKCQHQRDDDEKRALHCVTRAWTCRQVYTGGPWQGWSGGPAGRSESRVHDMNNKQEVRVQTWGPSEGTQHRRDKCPRATEGAVEVIGAKPFRAKAKRRKASVRGELAASSEARTPKSTYGRSGDEMALKLVVLTHGDLPGPARAEVPENERTKG